MQAHIVLAHPEAKSFNAHLAQVARRSLEAQGWSVSLSDLYVMGFDPCERAEHYIARQQPDRFDVQAEQRHASERGTIPEIVTAEITGSTASSSSVRSMSARSASRRAASSASAPCCL